MGDTEDDLKAGSKAKGNKIVGSFQNANSHGVDLVTRNKGVLALMGGATVGRYHFSPGQAGAVASSKSAAIVESRLGCVCAKGWLS